VVVHGDPSLNNLLVDPGGAKPVTFIDVGRAGRADRHLDLAVFLRGLGDHWHDRANPDLADRFIDRYGLAPDEDRLAWYRLLDEFF
jgi:kanamycin kinase